MVEQSDRVEAFSAWFARISHRIEKVGDAVGNQLVDGFHLVALFVIGGTVAWSAAYEYIGMIEQGYAEIKDILLLFIYLELGAMVGIHFKTHRLPVQFLLYVAITALTRVLVIQIKTMSDLRILVITGGIAVLTFAVLVLRYASFKFPPFASRTASDDV